MENPLDSLPDIEVGEPQKKMTPEQELALVKAPMYQSQKQTDLLIEATINGLYNQLMEKTAIIKALQAENAKLRKTGKVSENPPENPQN